MARRAKETPADVFRRTVALLYVFFLWKMPVYAIAGDHVAEGFLGDLPLRVILLLTYAGYLAALCLPGVALRRRVFLGAAVLQSVLWVAAQYAIHSAAPLLSGSEFGTYGLGLNLGSLFLSALGWVTLLAFLVAVWIGHLRRSRRSRRSGASRHGGRTM